MNRKPPLQSDRKESIGIRDMWIERLPDGSYWLGMMDGEGMQTSEEKLYAALRDFYRREF